MKWHETCSCKLEDWRLDHRGIEISYLRPEDASRYWWQTQPRCRRWRSPTTTTTPTTFELHGRLKSLMLQTTAAAASRSYNAVVSGFQIKTTRSCTSNERLPREERCDDEVGLSISMEESLFEVWSRARVEGGRKIRKIRKI
ncbi:hypothetical protein L3X38_003156 [Prunus dulcis]|uniref:Uncharacterized protein n=1 Tax=Prunus dulcis TaxID=3755 RepID=A0AAD4ZLI6_PRUDU|nr:hypothetical protein L3X38_003156 [Prunus dulcis]